MHPDLYNFHTRSLATTSATLGFSNSSALSLTEPSASLGNHQSCHYSNSWNDGCPLATAGFFTPAKQALGTTHCPDHSAWSEWYHSSSLSKGGQHYHQVTSPSQFTCTVHSFDSVLFGSHDNFSAPSVLPSQQQSLPSSGHLLNSLAVCPLTPVSQLTPITLYRFQHELRLHLNPDKAVYVVQGLGDGFQPGFNYNTSLKSAGGIWLWHS